MILYAKVIKNDIVSIDKYYQLDLLVFDEYPTSLTVDALVRDIAI